ncbi:MAG: alpha/beta fold hydrolase [Flavobacteriaceae bacterium]
MDILHHNTHGSGTRQLVILHGFLGMGDNWKTHAKAWAEKGFQVHLIDQRNHGRSFWSAEFNYDLMAEDLLWWMNHHKIDKATLLGHSMGGKTAMNFASKQPERVEKLVVADISPRTYPPHHEQILSSLAALDFRQITSRKAAEDDLAKTIKEVGVRQFLLKNLYWKAPNQLGLRVNIEVLKSKGKAIGAPLNSEAHCNLSALFLAGGNSNYILPEDQLLIKKHFPYAQIETIPKAGHWLHAENPAAFSAAILNFLAI